MNTVHFQKGKFYTLPVTGIIEDESSKYFLVSANGRDYTIRMFDFQAEDPEYLNKTELPCMVKNILGDNIVFVQNFSKMLGPDYDPDVAYSFTVVKLVSTLPDGRKYYDIRDKRGVSFRLKTRPDIYLQPRQRINCRVKLVSENKLDVIYQGERKRGGICIFPDQLLKDGGLDPHDASILEKIFYKSPIFAEAREYLNRNDAEWALKAILAVPGLEKWESIRVANQRRLLDAYHRLCLYLLEESKYLMVFTEDERENFQEWIAAKVENIEIYSECLDLIKKKRHIAEIDNILYKIQNSGFIYKPEHKMALLIAIFSMCPDLLEKRIESILDIIANTAWSRKLPSFKKAFCLFIKYYIDTNYEKVNREAFIDDAESGKLLHHLVRSICYLLLMNDGEELDVPLYKSMLFHYLSFVRYKNVLGRTQREDAASEALLERAFRALMSSGADKLEFNWEGEFGRTEIFAYKMSRLPMSSRTMTTRSFESENVRFTVSNEGITIGHPSASGNERNVLPADLQLWHNIQLFVENPNKYQIGRNANIKQWRDWWNRVEKAVVSKPDRPQLNVQTIRKVAPEIGDKVMLRVLRRDSDNRYYCRIEDERFFGEGWLDSYVKGGAMGLFHYDPMFNLNSFFYEDAPLLFEANVVSVINSNDENPRYIFDALTMMDEFARANITIGTVCNSRVIYHDPQKKIMLGVTDKGFSAFMPDTAPNVQYGMGDIVKIRLTQTSQLGKIQGVVIGEGDDIVDIRSAAEDLLFGYADGRTYQETAAELDEEAMLVSEDQFDASYIRQLIYIFDHKAVMEVDRIRTYAYLSIANILAGMIEDESMQRYLDQRRRLVCVLEDFGRNGNVNDADMEVLNAENVDLVESYPLLKQKICQIKIVNSFGKQENNDYLWSLTQTYGSGHILGKLARLMLSYNMADGFALQEHRDSIVDQIKSLLNISIKLPKIYSFGQESQTVEFKTSVVYPPAQGMRPNFQEQMFNILKVIGGMVNAYGGTLYLGVYDTGTAKGLEDDLRHFENNQDKYKLYVRNEIRKAFGAAINASVVEETPEAGDHWVYALKLRPAKEPVVMKYGGSEYYFFREGSSTYPYEDREELARIMEERDFEEYKIAGSAILTDMVDGDEDVEAEEKHDISKETTARKATTEEKALATSRLRRNIVENWLDDYGLDTCGYMRIYSDGQWRRLEDVEWEEGLLTLAINQNEREGSLMLVYEDGEVQRVAISDIVNSPTDRMLGMQKNRMPIFVSPACQGDALLIIYEGSDGKTYMRLDDVSSFPIGKITDKGTRFVEFSIDRVKECEIIPPLHHDALSKIHNQKRKYSGFPIDNTYCDKERELLRSLGLQL